jgi:hypothetical protein
VGSSSVSCRRRLPDYIWSICQYVAGIPLAAQQCLEPMPPTGSFTRLIESPGGAAHAGRYASDKPIINSELLYKE